MRDQHENPTGQSGCGCGDKCDAEAGADSRADCGCCNDAPADAAATGGLTIVVNLAARQGQPMTPAVEEVTASLRAANVPFEAVPDIAALAARKDPAIRRWAAAADPRIFGLPHRAVKWLFHAAGAELPENAMAIDLPADPNDDLAAAELVERLLGPRAGGRLADDAKPAGEDKCACDDTTAPCGCETQTEAATGQTCAAGTSTSQTRAAGDSAEPDTWVPWFPVIDYDRCTACRQCANFCLFGVFEVGESDGRVVVARPRSCKTNCPACARMCPKGAIMFPYYPAAPINGREQVGEAASQAPAGDLKEALRGDIYSVLRARGGGGAAAGVGDLGGRKATPADLARLAEQAEIPPQVLMSLGVAPGQSGKGSACTCESPADGETSMGTCTETRTADGKTGTAEAKTCGCDCETGDCACGNECETDGGTCGCERESAAAEPGCACETDEKRGKGAAGCGCHDKSDPQPRGN